MKRRERLDGGVIGDSIATPPKQVIMYYAKDDDPDRLYTIAYLEDVTVDRIAKRVVEMLDQQKRDLVTRARGTAEKKRGKRGMK